MNLAVLKTVGGPKVQRAALQVQKFAPEILTGVGIAGIVASTIMIAKASTKLEPIHDEFKAKRSNMADIKQLMDGDAEFDEKEHGKDLTRIYVTYGKDLGKLYGPGVTLSVASLVSILAAHGIMQRRSVALMGAYKAVESAFSTYRARVIEEFGEDKDRDFRLGIRTETLEDPETGKKKKVKSIDPNGLSSYAVYFDEFNVNWREVPEYNRLFLKTQQNYANDMLRARGHIFLNEVYDMLGVERSHAGQAVGWAITKDGTGDNFVDFGMFGADASPAMRNFVNGGNEPVIILDFNVDGVILDLIGD